MKTVLIPIVLLLMCAGCGYVGRRMWLLLPMDNAYKMVVLGLLLATLVCFFFNFIVGLDRFSLSVARVFYEVGGSSIFILLYLVMLFLALDLGRLIGLVPSTFLRHSVPGTLFVLVSSAPFSPTVMCTIITRCAWRLPSHHASRTPNPANLCC